MAPSAGLHAGHPFCSLNTTWILALSGTSRLFFSGRVRTITGGFRAGTLTRKVVTSTPDLICVLDNETGEPVTTEGMRYGNRVAVLGVPCDSRWTTPEGLRLTGPRAFGYDHDYTSILGPIPGGKK